MSIFGSAWNAVTDAADVVADTAGAAAGSVGDVLGAAGAVADAATLGAASGLMDVIDDTVLDTIDEATGGIIDVDFDDGNFSASAGIEGVMHAGASIGEDGIAATAGTILAEAELSATEDGFGASSQAGVDWGPLPYAEAGVTIEADGDVAFDGRAQGTVPTQYGLVSGKVEADFVQDGDVWGARLDAEGTLRTTDGSIIKAGVDVAYAETEDGSAFNVGLEGSYGRVGMGSVGGSVGYQRVEDGDAVIEGIEGEVFVEGFGERLEAGADYLGVETAEGSFSSWDTHIGDDADVQPRSQNSPTGINPNGPPTEPHLIEGAAGPAVLPAPVGDYEPGAAPAFTPNSAAAPMAEPAATFESEPAPFEPEPTSFDHAIEAADSFEDSVDDLFADFE